MASIQGIYLALFGRPADPAGLAYWTEQSKNGADLSKIIDTMTKLPEATARFNGLTDAALVTVVYQALFDRLPDAAGLAFFTDQLKSGKQTIGSIAINILDGASGNDLTLIQNREKAANVFTASIDTPAEIAAYSGTNAANFARDFIKTVSTDPNTIPTPAKVQTSINTGLPSATGGQTPTDGQTPTTGGGGGGTTPAPAVSSLDSTKNLVLAANADATVTLSGSTLVISANGFSSSFINAADVEKITLSSGAKLHTLGTGPLNGATNLKEISGAGTLDVQGVVFRNAVNNSADSKANFEPTPSLDKVYGLVKAGTGFTVNGNEADTIKGIWDVLDDKYDPVADNTALNRDFVNLGLRYVDYITKGGTPFTDLIAKVNADGRSQSMHDNLLGNLNKASIEFRFKDAASEILKSIPEGYSDRAIFSGNKADLGKADHDAARAFDYAKGWARPDYLDKSIKSAVDASASTDGKLYVGNGNTATGFNVVRHEGAGVELALKAKVRKGEDYNASEPDKDGVVTYSKVKAGFQEVTWNEQSAKAADWSFDFSVATGIQKGSTKTLADYKFKLFVDVDKEAGVQWVELDLLQRGTADTPWVLATSKDTVVINDDDGKVNAKISQNSANIGFNSIISLIDNNKSDAGVQPYDFGKGTFDIKLEAYDSNNVLLAANHIRVDVDPLA